MEIWTSRKTTASHRTQRYTRMLYSVVYALNFLYMYSNLLNIVWAVYCTFCVPYVRPGYFQSCLLPVSNYLPRTGGCFQRWVADCYHIACTCTRNRQELALVVVVDWWIHRKRALDWCPGLSAHAHNSCSPKLFVVLFLHLLKMIVNCCFTILFFVIVLAMLLCADVGCSFFFSFIFYSR